MAFVQRSRGRCTGVNNSNGIRNETETGAEGAIGDYVSLKMNETQDKIGKTLDGTEKRDAVHIAVAPVIITGEINRGDYLKIVPGTKNRVVKCNREEAIGIADPFLEYPAEYEDEIIYMFMFPNTVTNLRHEWMHPAFGKPNKSITWLREFARRYRTDFDEMLKGVVGKSGIFFGTDTGADIIRNDYDSEFWHHIQKATGIVLSEEDKEQIRDNTRCGC